MGIKSVDELEDGPPLRKHLFGLLGPSNSARVGQRCTLRQVRFLTLRAITTVARPAGSLTQVFIVYTPLIVALHSAVPA